MAEPEEDMYGAADVDDRAGGTRYSLDEHNGYAREPDPADDVADPHAPIDGTAVDRMDQHEVTER